MTEFFSMDSPDEEFALPGDQDTLARVTGEQPRAEDGRFAAKDEPADVQPEAVAETPEVETAVEADESAPQEAAEPELILGKFKSADELAAAYQELESFKGRQSNELSELRRALEERLDTMAQPTAQHVQITQDLIAEDPATATHLAFEQNNAVALKAAYEEWEEQQPARAAAWYAQRQIDANNREWQERYQQLEQRIEPLSQQTTQTELQTRVSALREQYPDIAEFMAGTEFADLANKIPLARKALTDGTPEEVASAVETVYLIHRGRATDNLKDTARDVARTAAEEAQKVREEAFVASATATQTAPRLSRADEIAAGWDDHDALFDNGWNV